MKQKLVSLLLTFLMVFSLFSVTALAAKRETIDLAGTVTWKQDTEEDRPEEVIVSVSDGKKTVGSKATTAAQNWSWKIENLPRYDKGTEISYTISVEPIEGYNSTVQLPAEPLAAMDDFVKEPNCKMKSFSLGDDNIVVAKLTSHDDYLLWTKTEIKGAEKEALITLVKDTLKLQKKEILYIYGTGASHENGRKIATFNEDKIVFSESDTWAMFWHGTVSFSGYEIINTKIVPTTYRIEIPVEKVVTQKGNVHPGKESFTLEMSEQNTEFAYQMVENTVLTDGAGTFKGTLVFEVVGEENFQKMCEGFTIGETDGKVENWNYDTTKWMVHTQKGENDTLLYTIQKVGDESQNVYQVLRFENDYTKTVTVPHSSESKPIEIGGNKTEKNPNTGAPMISLAPTLLLFGTAAVLLRKKKQ